MVGSFRSPDMLDNAKAIVRAELFKEELYQFIELIEIIAPNQQSVSGKIPFIPLWSIVACAVLPREYRPYQERDSSFYWYFVAAVLIAEQMAFLVHSLGDIRASPYEYAFRFYTEDVIPGDFCNNLRFSFMLKLCDMLPQGIPRVCLFLDAANQLSIMTGFYGFQ